MTSWFRSWHGAPTDNKWLVIAAKAHVKPGVVSAVAWALFDYASQCGERGSVAGFDVETYAVFSGFSEDDITAVLAAMRGKGVIDDGDRLTAWDKRQPKREDDSTERVKRYRERSNAMKRTVTHGNNTDPETDPDPETETETETEAETEDNARKRTVTQSNAQTHARTDTDLTQAVAAKLESVGIALTPYIVDSYVAAAHDNGIHAVLAGITAAAEQGKQHRMSYVLACIRNKATGDSRQNGTARTNGNGNGHVNGASKVARSMAAVDAVFDMIEGGGE